jgi:tetraacyldisaccharide 4'-kinase
MREPGFWRVRDLRSRSSSPLSRMLLTPVAAAYAWGGARRIAEAKPIRVEATVVCIGNVTLGGAGKTPVSALVRDILGSTGARSATLSRGYGGRLPGPVRVDATAHQAADVGDEPLMLALRGESWISRDRVAGARAMAADGVGVIVMDDGHQNPDLARNASVVVIDAGDPFGNGFVFPKGPLREPPSVGLSRADLIVLMGEGISPPEVVSSGKPVFRAQLASTSQPPPGTYVAFAGIGRPSRYFDFLRALPGIVLSEELPFADHHAYSVGDLRYLESLARERGAGLITTEKDWVRLPQSHRDRIVHTPVSARFDDPAGFEAALLRLVARERPA